jgi:hypothetical protein
MTSFPTQHDDDPKRDEETPTIVKIAVDTDSVTTEETLEINDECDKGEGDDKLDSGSIAASSDEREYELPPDSAPALASNAHSDPSPPSDAVAVYGADPADAAADAASTTPRKRAVRLSPTYFCPYTRELFQDPVVAPDGKSYEREAIEATKDYPQEQLYLNRALQSIIKERFPGRSKSLKGVAADKENEDADFRSKLSRLERAIKTSFAKLNEQYGNGHDTENGTGRSEADPEEGHCEPLPEGYFCPITYELIHHPVIDPEGTTYEKNAITAWIHGHGSSPFTRTPLAIEELRDNRAIADLLQEEKSQPEATIHPMIRSWMEQEPEAPSLEGILATMNLNALAGGAGNGADGASYGAGAVNGTPPSTEVAMNQAREGQNERSCLAFLLIISCYFVTLLVPYGLIIFIVFSVILCCYQKIFQDRQQHQEELREERSRGVPDGNTE